ncbi:MAG: hypothetical protein A4E62_01901 [Syntrophorhabdus sp. PtaU1.Bin002]|nr:MAG: hypothetical protein A4E62_01901 [Syntrophorhabdus sp. PtaU1.Bin002]
MNPTYYLANRSLINDTISLCQNDSEKADTKVKLDRSIHQNGRQEACPRRRIGAAKVSAGIEINHSNILLQQEGQETYLRRRIGAVAIHGDGGKENLFPHLIGQKESLDLYPVRENHWPRNRGKRSRRLP